MARFDQNCSPFGSGSDSGSDSSSDSSSDNSSDSSSEIFDHTLSKKENLSIISKNNMYRCTHKQMTSIRRDLISKPITKIPKSALNYINSKSPFYNKVGQDKLKL